MSESQQDIALGLYEKALHHRIADLESRAKALETELKAANEYRDMWKQTALGQEARAQKAEADLKVARKYHDIWVGNIRLVVELRAQKAKAEVARWRALCGEAARVAPLFDVTDEWREVVARLGAESKGTT